MPTLTVNQDASGLRLDKFLRRILPNMPLSHVYRLLRKRKVRVNGKRGRPEQLLAEGDRVLVHMPEKQFREDLRRRKRPVTSLDFRVVFEDEFILVISKPPFLPVHPGAGHEGNSLIDQIHTYLGVGQAPTAHRPALAHRLDRDTSGLMLVGKTGPALRELNRMFHDGEVTKSYLALVRGRPEPAEGVWEMVVQRRDIPGSERLRSRGRQDGPGRTAYRIADERNLLLPEHPPIPVSLLALRLLTGRTHQIRSHLFQIGCPLLGDPRYGDVALNQTLLREFGLRRQFLHAFILELNHPITTKRLRWSDPFPPDLLPLAKVLKLPNCDQA